MADSVSITEEDGVWEPEETFRSLLSPLEPLVMKIQSLLVWENPQKSALLFLFIHFVFWFVAVYGCQFYFTVAMVALILYVTHTWKRKIWPEIRVPPPIPEDPDSWTPVHPRLMSVPEISQRLGHHWLTFHNYINCWLAFRKNHHFLFCVVNSSVLILSAGLGRYISDFTLTYIIVISVLLWPCVLYNKLMSKFYLNAEPLLMKLDYSLKLKPQWIFKEKKPHKSTVDYSFLSESSRCDSAETDSDCDDFTPSPDPLVAALARAITDSEDEGTSPTLGTPCMGTPRLSKEPSIDLDQRGENDEDSDSEAEFALEVSEMPSLDDELDHTDDELLDSINHQENSSMAFVPTHFEDSESEDEVSDLNFQDVNYDSIDSHLDSPPQHTNSQTTTEIRHGFAAATGKLVSQTLTSVVGSALQGISNITHSAISQAKHSGEPQSSSRTGENCDIPHTKDLHELQSGDFPRAGNSDQCEISDADILEEFEFLENYEDLSEDEK